jgi:hypothetical protein
VISPQSVSGFYFSTNSFTPIKNKENGGSSYWWLAITVSKPVSITKSLAGFEITEAER